MWSETLALMLFIELIEQLSCIFFKIDCGIDLVSTSSNFVTVSLHYIGNMSHSWSKKNYTTISSSDYFNASNNYSLMAAVKDPPKYSILPAQKTTANSSICTDSFFARIADFVIACPALDALLVVCEGDECFVWEVNCSLSLIHSVLHSNFKYKINLGAITNENFAISSKSTVIFSTINISQLIGRKPTDICHLEQLVN